MDETLKLDPDAYRQTLIQECGNQAMLIVQLKAAVQQLLTEKAVIEVERDSLQARVDVFESTDSDETS